MNEALLIIDMQKYFYNLHPQIFDQKIIPNLLIKMAECRKRKIQIIHIRTIYSVDKRDWPKARKNESKIWCLKDSGDEEFIDGFSPQGNEIEIIKTRYSSFYQTCIKSVLKKEKINKLMLSGFASDVCIRATAFDAYNEGFEVILLLDCMHSIREEFESTIEYLEWVVKAKRAY